MTFSMTGYGKLTATYKGRALTIEIRTLNSKQTDISVRTPSLYREKEFEIRDMLSNKLGRGKIDFTVQRDLSASEATSALNEEVVAAYYHLIKKLEHVMDEPPGKSATDYMSLILKMPDALKQTGDTLDEDEYEMLKQTTLDCINMVNAFREQEGAKLETVLRESTEKILYLLAQVGPLEAERMDRIKGRIMSGMGEEMTENLSFDPDRFEQELIYYLEKLDISEEKVRLQAHCDYFLKTLDEDHLKGKKLSFIAQEMGREINTLGSKAQHSEIQRIVVRMKDELERIKEQVLNVL